MKREAPRHLTAAAMALAAIMLVFGLVGITPPTSAAAEPSSYSIWDSSVKPANPVDTDVDAVEVGTRFSVGRVGQITSLRIYRGPGNSSARVGSLWSSTGQRLGQATFPSQNTVGWQSATLPAPISVQGGQQYVVSYYAPNGGYAGDPEGLSTPVTSYALTALRGVYSYGGGFPSEVWRSSNYFVDVVFRPTTITATPTATATPTPTVKPSAAPTTTPKPTTTPSPTVTAAPTPPATTSPSSGTRPVNCAPKPSACGYPDASNTGIKAGVTLKKSGSVNADRNGQVIDGLDITGEINVTASNVVIKNTRVTGGRGAGSADWVDHSSSGS